MFEKITNRYTTTYLYRNPKERSWISAVEWFCSLVNTQTVKAEKVTLRDTQHRNDEGNLSVEYLLPLDSAEIAEQISVRGIDCITVSGLLGETSLAISLDIKTLEVGIAMRNAVLLDEATLETALHLS